MFKTCFVYTLVYVSPRLLLDGHDAGFYYTTNDLMDRVSGLVFLGLGVYVMSVMQCKASW